MRTEPPAPENCGRAEETVISSQSFALNGVSPSRLTPAPASAERALTETRLTPAPASDDPALSATWLRLQDVLLVDTWPPATRLAPAPMVTTPPRMVSMLQPPA